MDFYKGEIILINKDKGWTSFDVVNKVRNIIRRKYGQKLKVGHAGTLDPLASGLLIICTGKKTKSINEFMGLDKEYIATVGFGATTPSYDLETDFDNHYPTDHLTEELLQKTLETFKGIQKQTPPIFSAKKIKGQKAYNIARKGKQVDIKEVEVNFKEIELLEANLPEQALIRLLVSKGTYIRSFAHDLGQKLGTGSYLKDLIRTKIGNFSLEDSMTITEFEQLVKNIIL